METTHKQIVLGILAHVDSGKTTLSEAMLYRSGAIRKLGRVDHKDAFLDTDTLEKARGITIFSKQALLTAGNTDITLLDTPGHVDFSTETERTLRDATGASFNECRIVQRLGETDHPERIGALAEQLMMSPVNAARAVERLVSRGWAKRLKSPHDKKAVYVALTDEGVYQGFLISATVNELAATKLWVRLTPEQRDAIERVGHVVVADLNAQRQAKEQAAYDLLREI